MSLESLTWLNSKLIMVMGKGGVGKTTLARGIGQFLAQHGKKVLVAHVLQLGHEKQKLTQVSHNLWDISLSSHDCFQEYVMMKLRIKSLYTLLLGNHITQYLEKAAPGVKELVLLGKVWFERNNYDHVVVDMPSSGYAMAMLHTPHNFSRLFPGGPVYHDCLAMIATLKNPRECALINLTLPEEMPLQESQEFAKHMRALIPENPSHLVINRRFFENAALAALQNSCEPKLSAEQKNNPLWKALIYRLQRAQTQTDKLSFIRNQSFFEFPEFSDTETTPVEQQMSETLVEAMAP